MALLFNQPELMALAAFTPLHVQQGLHVQCCQQQCSMSFAQFMADYPLCRCCAVTAAFLHASQRTSLSHLQLALHACVSA
jgi:hypothetical protein